jgi:hypothetical protein
MRFLLIIFLFLSLCIKSQDKIFFKNGSMKQESIVSIGKDYVFIRNTDNTAINKYPLSDIRLIERYDGRVLVYADQKELPDSLPKKISVDKRNSLSVRPFSFLSGRLSAEYEYLNEAGTIGFAFPVSLTFDPFGTVYQSSFLSRNGRFEGYNVIAGADVNFYIGKYESVRFFIGPRFRYGVDMSLGNVEAYSLQTQFGWRIGHEENKITQKLSFGFGFARILSSQAGTLVNAKQSYGWGSINYSIGVKW